MNLLKNSKEDGNLLKAHLVCDTFDKK